MNHPWSGNDAAVSRSSLRTMAERFASLASNAPDLDRPVAATPGWSILDTLGHVAMEPSRYNDLAKGGGTWPATASKLPAFNAEQIRTLPTRNPQELADKLIADTDELVDTVAALGDESTLMNFDGNQRIRADRSLGTLLGEFVIHGRDIARTLDVPWPIHQALVPLVLDGLHQVMPGWLDPDRAAGHTATYRVRLRGLGVTHTYDIRDGRLTVDPDDTVKVDVHISADPATWLLLSYGRIDQWTPALTGRILVWGRKPWLAAGFSRLFRSA